MNHSVIFDEDLFEYFAHQYLKQEIDQREKEIRDEAMKDMREKLQILGIDMPAEEEVNKIDP